MNEAKHPDPPAPAAAVPAQPRMRVLCVDDEPRILEGLALGLRRQYDVRTAGGAAAGLEILHRDREIAVVVSDMRMPGADGVSFLRLARDLAPDTARILLTGNIDLSGGVDAINDGQICALLLKPCPPDALLAAVEAGCSQYRLKAAHRLMLERAGAAASTAETFREAARVFGCRYAAMGLHDGQAWPPRQVWTCGLDRGLFADAVAPLIARVAGGRDAIHLRGDAGAAGLDGLPHGHPRVTELLGLALPVAAGLRGWLYFADLRPHAAFGPDDIRAAAVLARLCADACTAAPPRRSAPLPDAEAAVP
ncbi:MAG: response regulator [Gammaproteobacteria bacterium]|nr:response regulator [Gammaproteobacteria bacterium]